ncbi:MAG: RNA polymerase factor sigma-54 [Deltaproteobacteria bacterium]|nr:RNA polymerase factor sigma-54 [Deltaproteobacteria bacterium]
MGNMELRQNLKLTQQLVMTPRLQLAIKMLALNNIELSDMIKQEIAENPIIDIDAAVFTGEAKKETLLENVKNQVKDEGSKSNGDAALDDAPSNDALFDGSCVRQDSYAAKELADYLVNYNEQFFDLSKDNGGGYKYGDKNYIIENSFYSVNTLYESIMEQVRTGNFSSQEVKISEYIAGNLDSNGFLAISKQELADYASCNIFKKKAGGDADIDKFIDSALTKIGRLEPVGLAAFDTVSSLLIQSDYYFKDDDLLKIIIKNYLKDVANKNYQKISKETGKNTQCILDCVERLKRLNPRPAANFGQAETRFISPDLYLKKIKGKYVVFMDDDYIPQIKINSYYKKVLSGEIVVSSDMKNYVEDRFKSASWLVKSINTRKETILKIAELIVNKQADYFDNGMGNLKHLILKDIAAELNIHESTVSRATSNKYLSTHLGVFELKSFFSSASYGDSSSENVMARIKKIIARENALGRVYHDNEITDLLKGDGIVIARRTIAKYREIMNIPPSSQRNKLIKSVK